MKKYIFVLTVIIILLSAYSSYVGISSMNYKLFDFENVGVERYYGPEEKEGVILVEGVYRYNPIEIVTKGIQQDWIRLLFSIPIMIGFFILYLKKSTKGTLLFMGSLFYSFYQYLIFALGWHFNELFIVYIIIYSLSIVTLILVLIELYLCKSEIPSISRKFSNVLAINFSIVIFAMIIKEGLVDIAPYVSKGDLPRHLPNIFTLFNHAIDLGILLPVSIAAVILLFNQSKFSILLSPMCLITIIHKLAINVLGEIMAVNRLGLSSIQINRLIFLIVFLLFNCLILIKLALSKLKVKNEL